jgi:hypothetical protein
MAWPAIKKNVSGVADYALTDWNTTDYHTIEAAMDKFRFA